MLFSRETRRKLSALRRGTPEGAPEPRPLDTTVAPAPDPPNEPVPVEDLFSGEVVEGDFGLCYVMRRPVEMAREAALSRSLGVQPEADLAFLDIETLGLASLPVFLVGVLRYRNGALSLTQILARDVPEEAQLLAETVAGLEGATALFTYNGASFDLPYLHERAIYHGVDWWVEAKHVDLLKPARRRFRSCFPDCRLQTLETRLCGRSREDDIPGAEIPRRYQDFVRTGDGRLLEVILRHNQLDLLTLAELVPHCTE
jgi:uncharacterized protein YprB with RNaseH-like and TPR domain